MNFLELNDHEMTLYSGSGERLKQEPAAVAMIGNDLVFGEHAISQGRIHPQGFNNRYLGSTTAEPLPSPIGSAHNFADLIYQHLTTFNLTQAPLVMLTPTHVANEQLGLLLGICQELGIEVRGFIELALVQALSANCTQTMQVLDIEWHRLTLTTVSYENDQISVTGHKVWEGRGLNHLLEGWMGVIADEFMHRTRFDPLHRGDTEQQLFQQAYAWLNGNFNQRIKINGSDSDRELDIQRIRVSEKTEQRLEGLDLDTEAPLFLTPRVHRVPDLPEILSIAHGNVHKLTDSGTGYLDELGGELPTDRVTRLSKTTRRGPTTLIEPPASKSPDELATHLLDEQHCASPISAFEDLDQNIGVGQSVTYQHKPYVAIKVK